MENTKISKFDFIIELLDDDREWSSWNDYLEKLQTLEQIDKIRKEEEDHGEDY